MHYAGTIADSNAYTLKIDGTNTRSVCSIIMAAPLLAFRQLLEQKIGAVDLGLPKVLLRLCMRLLSSSSSLVISGSTSWGLSRTPAMVLTKLWLCNSLVGNNLSCHSFKYMMVMTRVMWC